MLAFLRPSATVAAIARLNDALRRDPGAHGHVLFSPGVMALIDTATPRAIAPVAFAQQQLIQLAGLASDFTGSNRDRAERRCGRFSFRGHALAFAIEYRDAAALRPARRPADPAATRRILTIMLDREEARGNPLPARPRSGDTPSRPRGPSRPLAREYAPWPYARPSISC
ncbi:DUF3768 domain-containing protein [Sphingomonas oryzagri]